jgi:hypothetical protein
MPVFVIAAVQQRFYGRGSEDAIEIWGRYSGSAPV